MFKYSKPLLLCIIINLFNINIIQASIKKSTKVWTPVDASRSARLGAGWQSNETMISASGALVSEVDRSSALTASQRIALLNGSRRLPVTPSTDGSVIVTVGPQADNSRMVVSSQDLAQQSSVETFAILNTKKPEKSKTVRVQKNRTLKRGEFEKLATLKRGEFERIASSVNTNNTEGATTENSISTAERTNAASSTGKLESTVSPQLAYRIDQWVQGNISDSKIIKAMEREKAYSSDSSFLRALDNIDSHYDIGSIDVTMNTDALHKLNNVTGKRSGLAAVQYCIEHGIYCGGGGDGSPPHDDNLIAGMSKAEQKHLFIATLHDIYEEDKDAAVRLVNDRHTEHKTLDLYDEIPDIIGAVTNHRSQGHVVTMATTIDDNTLTTTEGGGNIQDTESGVAAGEENPLGWFKGVWIRGLYGDINQGQKSGQVGFHGQTKGGTIGIDGNLNDNTIVGLSYTRMLANFKYKKGQGNKVDTLSDFISLYGVNKINNSFILQGLFSAGKTSAKQKTQHLVGINTFKAATGKSNVTTYSVESILNYKIPVSNSGFYIMPNVGFRFNKNYDGGYSEHGAGIYNLTVSSKEHSSWAIITGIKMGKAHRISDSLTITTGIHAEIDHYVHNKTKQAKTKMQWSDTFIDGTTIAIKTDKTGYNVGASLLGAHKAAEILATYNLHLRGKYTSHQGSLRFSLLF